MTDLLWPLMPMDNAPKDGIEILAYHKAGKTLHPVKWNAERSSWQMRWNKEYNQYTGDFSGWIPMPKVSKPQENSHD